jgi:hypothetical protein
MVMASGFRQPHRPSKTKSLRNCGRPTCCDEYTVPVRGWSATYPRPPPHLRFMFINYYRRSILVSVIATYSPVAAYLFLRPNSSGASYWSCLTLLTLRSLSPTAPSYPWLVIHQAVIGSAFLGHVASGRMIFNRRVLSSLFRKL